MEQFSAILAICEGNPQVMYELIGVFSSQKAIYAEL